MLKDISLEMPVVVSFTKLHCNRVSCMVAGQEDVDVAAVVCLGYPLKVLSLILHFEALHRILSS